MDFSRESGEYPVYVYLSKILPVFVMPVSLVIILLLVALFLLMKGARRTATGLLVVAVAWLWVASTPYVAEALYSGLEARDRANLHRQRFGANVC